MKSHSLKPTGGQKKNMEMRIEQDWKNFSLNFLFLFLFFWPSIFYWNEPPSLMLAPVGCLHTERITHSNLVQLFFFFSFSFLLDAPDLAANRWPPSEEKRGTNASARFALEKRKRLKKKGERKLNRFFFCCSFLSKTRSATTGWGNKDVFHGRYRPCQGRSEFRILRPRI